VEGVAGREGDEPPRVTLTGGEVFRPPLGVVVATEAPAAAALLGNRLAASPSKLDPGVGTACLYFRWARASGFRFRAQVLGFCLYLQWGHVPGFRVKGSICLFFWWAMLHAPGFRV
jgi:hypothetical protein